MDEEDPSKGIENDDTRILESEKVENKKMENDEQEEESPTKDVPKGKEKRKKFSWWVLSKKFSLSLCIILTFFGGGMQFTSVGLTMNDMILFTGSDTVTMGLVYPIRGLGQVVTGLFVGVLADLCIRYRYKHGVFSISLLKFVFFGDLIMCISYIIIPVVPIPWLSILLFFGFGFGVQFLLVMNNILMEEIWLEVGEKYYKIFIFSLHCCFAIGALIYPFIVGGIYSLNLTPKENLILVYGISTFFQFFSLILIFFESPEKRTPTENMEKGTKEEEEGDNKKIDFGAKLQAFFKSKRSILRVVFVGVGFILVTIYTSIENHAGFLLFAFALSNDVSKVNASFMNSVLYIGFSVGRILGVFLSAFLSSQIYLLVDSCGLVIISIAFSITPSIEVLMYIYPAILAFFYSTIMTSILSSVKKYNIELSGLETAVFVFGNSVGGFFPFLSQVFLAKVTKETYVYITLFLSICFTLVFIAFHVIGIVYKRIDANAQSLEENKEVSKADGEE